MSLQQQQQPKLQQQPKDSRSTPSGGAIVVVAKCPIPGKSKTRLMPLLGEQGSASLAKAMLSDVLMTLDKCPSLDQVVKILFYAPGNQQGLDAMRNILEELDLNETTVPQTDHVDTLTSCPDSASGKRNDIDPSTIQTSNVSMCRRWHLVPMLSGDLQSSDLTQQLKHALEEARRIMGTFQQQQQQQQQHNHTKEKESDKKEESKVKTGENTNVGNVVFLGMDAPELPMDDIVAGLCQKQMAPSSIPSALLCPADDGGYGMLCIPSNATASNIFQGVHWSHPLTAISQVKALTDQNIHVAIGRLMYDIDEPEDVSKLCHRLQQEQVPNECHETFVLYQSNHWAPTTRQFSNHESCYFTKLALQELQQLRQSQD